MLVYCFGLQNALAVAGFVKGIYVCVCL